jgi:hypothetical protein
MVLSNDYLKNRLNEVKENYFNYMILSVEHLQEDAEKLECAINTLGVINTITMANSLYKESNSMISIDATIFYDILKAIFDEKPFTDLQLVEYYETTKKLERFWRMISKFRDIETTIPFKVDFLLLGLSFEEQESLSKENECELHNRYGDIFFSKESENIDTKTLIEKAKSEILHFKEKALTKCA